MCATIYVLLTLCALVFSKDVNDVLNKRNDLFNKELEMMIGNGIVLSDNEQRANDIIMRLKYQVLDEGFANPAYFNLSKHFFEYKDDLKDTELFQIIKDMPKGAVLHVHDTGLLSPDYVLNLTYWDHLHVCFHGDDLSFKFAYDEVTLPCPTRWQLMKDARYSSGDIEKFDADLRRHFTIVIDNPNDVYSDINVVWGKFAEYFIKTTALFSYVPVWKKYFYDTLKAVREDNAMYIEVRSVLPSLYDLDDNVYDSIYTAQCYKDTLDEFKKDYPDFFGAKLIYAPLRLVDDETVDQYIHTAKKLKKKFPDFFAGFDLVGQEDLGAPTKKFLALLAEAAEELDFFFHAGETNWNGASSDENLFDAIALGTKRIGHAFALAKHPVLIDEVRNKDIALEVNVVSNAVLKLVGDVRNHPLATFIAQGLPVVISSDDPGVWDAEPLTHDFYVTFVGVSSRHADLRLLKQLAINSLLYSTISNKDKVLYEFEVRWTKFIDNMLRDYWTDEGTSRQG